MHPAKRRLHVIVLLILSILLGEVCFDESQFKTYAFGASKSEITSGNQIHISKEKQEIRGERITGRSEAKEVLRRTNRRTSQLFGRRLITGFSFVDILPQLFHSTIYFQNNQICHNTSGHIVLIRCVYRKDGKKDRA